VEDRISGPRTTALPHWVAVANPTVMIVVGSLLSRVLPPPFSIWLDGAGLNLGMFFFMALSTKLLWHEPGLGLPRAIPLARPEP